MENLWAIEKSNILALSLGHGILWMAGLVGIGIGVRGLNNQFNKQKKAEEVIIRDKQEWEQTFNVVLDLIMILDDQH